MIYLFSVLFILAIFYYKSYKNTTDFIINTITPAPKSSNSTKLRVLQISDMHLEKLSISPTKLFNQLEQEQFDLIALTGDYLDQPKSISKLIPYLDIFKKLDPKHGIYAVFGNHDYRLEDQDFIRLKEVLEQYGIKAMQNDNETIEVDGNTLHIVGIDDHHTKRSDLKRSYNGLIENGYRLVLTHDPNLVTKMEQFDFDYLLSGHFHGGQIHWPKPFHLKRFGNLVELNLIKGLINYKGKVFYINEGLGQTLLNIRIGSRPEITIHDLYLNHTGVQQNAI